MIKRPDNEVPNGIYWSTWDGGGVALAANGATPSSYASSATTYAASSYGVLTSRRLWVSVPSGYEFYKAFINNGTEPDAYTWYYESQNSTTYWYTQEMTMDVSSGIYMSADKNWLGDQANWWSAWAVITPAQYTVTFNASGGSCTTTSMTVTYKTSYGTLPTPTRTGYTFAGWWTASSGGTQVFESSAYTTVGGQTLYAHWTANSYLNYYYYRNSSGTATSTTRSRTYGSSFTTLSSTSLSYYTSNGWSLYGWVYGSSTSTIRTYAASTSVTAAGYTQIAGDINWYAISSRALSLAYNANGGTYSGSSLSGVQYWNQYGGGTSSPSITVTSTAPTRAGYTFLGWATSSTATTATYSAGKVYSFSAAYSSAASVTLYAVWSANSYTVTFNANGGNCTTTTKTVTYASTYGTLPTPTRSYYTFSDWWTAASGGTQVLSTSTYTTVGDQILYAHWTPVPITNTVVLRYINADGTGGTVNSDLGGSVRVDGYQISGSTSTPVILTSSQTESSSAYRVHQGQRFRLQATANSGFVFVGFSTSSTPSSTIKNPTSAVSATAYFTPASNTTYYVYFKKVSDNRLKYDSTFKYFYFEDGEYPQSYVDSYSDFGDELVATGETININDPTGLNSSVKIYVDNENNRYARVISPYYCELSLLCSDGTTKTVSFYKGDSYLFKFEPIRWRVSDYGVSSTEYPSGWSGYTSYNTNFTAVSDLILGFGAMNSTRSVSEGALVTSMEGFVNVQNTTSLCAINNEYSSPSTSLIVDRYGVTANGEGNAVYSTSVAYSSPLRVVSIEEIEELGIKNKSARASDMVAFILGVDKDKVSYWTRDLSNLGSGVAISATGTEIRSWLNVCQGIRFAYTFSEGSRL